MSHFDPVVALNIISNSVPQSERRAFRQQWHVEVQKRVGSWVSVDSSLFKHQMEFASQVCQYVKFMFSKGLTNGRCDPNLPFYGPRFLPPSPTFLHRNPVSSSQILPNDFYLKPVTVVHELYWPSLLQCPNCVKAKREQPRLERQGFSSDGPRTVHGIKEEEYVIGSKIRCQTCNELNEANRDKHGDRVRIQWSFTSPEFWSDKMYWEIPSEVPHFLHRTAISRDLFNLINEFRLSVPAGRLREHIFQLHLLEYHQRRLQYLKLVAEKIGLSTRTQQQSRLDTFFTSTSAFTVKPFSDPSDPQGYNLVVISDDIITSKVLSFDATYKVTKKATLSTGSGPRQKPFETMVTMITEDNLIASWRFTFTELLLEIQAQLLDLRERFEALGVPPPVQAIVDNCCTVRNKVQEVLPETQVGLDVWHFSVRYTRTVKPTNNQHIQTIGQEIVSALLSSTAATSSTGRADYRKKEEQAKLMEDCFKKWKKRGAFGPTTDTVHEAAMTHIRKGCLERCIQDVRSDGSRIENANRGWNGIARAVPGGLEGFLMQAHDWVHRRNIRIAFGSKSKTSISDFVNTTFGCHHTFLVSEGTRLWNEIIRVKKLPDAPLPSLHSADIDEHFGLVHPIDGTFGVNSTVDIDYIGFEETLLLEDALEYIPKLEIPDDAEAFAENRDEIDNMSMSYGAAPMPVHDLAGTRTSVPPGNSELKKRPLSPNTLHSDQGVQSIKRQRHVIPVAEPDCGEESLMELVPDDQDLSEFIQSNHRGPTARASVGQQAPTATTSTSPGPSGSSTALKSKPQHPFFNRFQVTTANRAPEPSRSSTPFITPRVLPRPPAGTTRQTHSRSTSSRPKVHQTRSEMASRGWGQSGTARSNQPGPEPDSRASRAPPGDLSAGGHFPDQARIEHT